MEKYIKRIWYSHFVRNVAIVAGGTAGAQLIHLAFYPIITRLYGPENFGLLGVFMSVIAILAPMAVLTYPKAIVLPKNNSDAKSLVKLSFALSLGIAIFILLVFSTVGDQILSSIGADGISEFSLLIPFAILFYGWQQIGQQWLFRQQAFRDTAKASMIQVFISGVAKCVAGLFFPIASVLIGLQVASAALYAILLGLAANKYLTTTYQLPEKPRINHSVLALAKSYKAFPIYRAPQVTLNAASRSIPVFMLASQYSSSAAGFYVLGQMVLGAPLTLVAKSVGDAFYPKFTMAANNGQPLMPLLRKSTLALAILGIMPFGALIFFGPFMFSIVFGGEWQQAGEYARWLAIMYFFGFMNTPVVAASATLDLQKGLLIYELASTSLKIIAMYVGLMVLKSDLWAVGIFSIFGAASYTTLIIWVFFETRKFEERRS